MLKKIRAAVLGETEGPQFTQEEKRLLYLLTAGFDLERAIEDIQADAHDMLDEYEKKKTGGKGDELWIRLQAKITDAAFERADYIADSERHHHKSDVAFEIITQSIAPEMVGAMLRDQASSPGSTRFTLPLRAAGASPSQSAAIYHPDSISSGMSPFVGSLTSTIHKWLGRDGYRGNTSDGAQWATFKLSQKDIQILQKIHNEMKDKIPPQEVEAFRNEQRKANYDAWHDPKRNKQEQEEIRNRQQKGVPFVISTIGMLSQKWHHPLVEPPAIKAVVGEDTKYRDIVEKEPVPTGRIV
jgi:hypothetical protein